MQVLKAQYYKSFGRNPKGRKASEPTWLKSEIQKKMKTLKDNYFDCYRQHPSGPDANEPGWLRQQILDRCSQILNDIFGKPEAKDFLQPVPWKELGLDNYLVECPEPMDLGTVRQKIQTYSDLGSFKHDVMLTFKNAMHYNREDSEIWKRAETLLKDFEALFKSPEMVAVQEEEAAREKYRDLKELCKRAKHEVGEKTQRKELEQRAVKTQLRAVETQLEGEKMAHQVTRSKLEAEEAARQQAETQLKDCQSRTNEQIQNLKIQVSKLQMSEKKALQEAADAHKLSNETRKLLKETQEAQRPGPLMIQKDLLLSHHKSYTKRLERTKKKQQSETRRVQAKLEEVQKERCSSKMTNSNRSCWSLRTTQREQNTTFLQTQKEELRATRLNSNKPRLSLKSSNRSNLSSRWSLRTLRWTVTMHIKHARRPGLSLKPRKRRTR